MKFSDEQRKAINSNEPFLFLQACAGSGKTRVIVERAMRLIDEGVDYKDILLITFTRRAAKEMRERLKDQRYLVYTFHQFCYQKLKEKIGYPYQIVEEMNLSIFSQNRLAISKYKNSLYRTIKPNSYDLYQDYLKRNRLKDFDDLLLDYLKFKCADSFLFIFIDEFQDTNLLQYEVLKELLQVKSSIFAVGDPNQSIYRFRGSDYTIIHRFIRDFKATVLTLSVNYRSTKNILNVANRLIMHNPKRDYLKLLSFHSDGEAVICFRCINRYAERIAIVDEIQKYHRLNPMHKMAILYRNHERAFEINEMINLNDDYYIRLNENLFTMTIHQAKGLEFDFVILLGLEQEELPSLRDNQEIELEEERRLCFVGMTRAKHKLVLSYVKSDLQNRIYTPSVFLFESRVKTHVYLPIK